MITLENGPHDGRTLETPESPELEIAGERYVRTSREHYTHYPSRRPGEPPDATLVAVLAERMTDTLTRIHAHTQGAAQ